MSKSNREIILDAITDLHNCEQIVTRELLAEVLGIKKSIIDVHIVSLYNDEEIYKVARGVYAPTPVHAPARGIWKRTLPCGTVKIEIGDIVLTLTPKEARMLGKEMMGDGMQYANIEMGHALAQANAIHENKIRQLELENRKLKELSAD